jgi:hypothetical protein
MLDTNQAVPEDYGGPKVPEGPGGHKVVPEDYGGPKPPTI